MTPLLLALVALPASAQTLASWDFEDCLDDGITIPDPSLIADVTNGTNVGQTITISGNLSSCSTGNPDGTAASYTSMANQEASSIIVPVNTSGATGISFSIALRPSNTANKWFRVGVSVAGGGYTALSPLIELQGSTWTTHPYSLPAGAEGQADVNVRVIATDSNGDGGGVYVQADGDGVPSNGGTVRIDTISFSAATGVDAGPPPPDAGPQDAGYDAGPAPPVDAGPVGAPPIISEVAWFGSTSSSSDEFVELYNPGPAIPDLSRFRLIDDTGAVTLPAVALASGAVIVLEKGAATTSLESPAAVVLTGFHTLSNTSGESLRVCPEGAENDLAACDIASIAGQAWPAGDNTTNATMIRRRDDLEGAFASSWKTYVGPVSAATDSGGAGIVGSPGSFTNEIPGFDAGPGTDGGQPPVGVDAGPNDAPTISLAAPTGSVSSAGEVAVVYTAADPDGADTASVALYYDTDDSGFDGVLIERGLPLGADREFTWLTTTVPTGTYRVFGVVTDGRGDAALGYAPGSVSVEAGGVSAGGSITLLEPDGVDDAAFEGRYAITWEIDLPAGEDGLVSLFYDTDDAGLDGEPILFGLAVLDAEGNDGPRGYAWDPADLEPGAYAIYAVLDWRGGSVSDYSEFLQVGDGGCACGAASEGGRGSAALWALLALGGLSLRRRRRRLGGRDRPHCTPGNNAEGAG